MFTRSFFLGHSFLHLHKYIRNFRFMVFHCISAVLDGRDFISCCSLCGHNINTTRMDVLISSKVLIDYYLALEDFAPLPPRHLPRCWHSVWRIRRSGAPGIFWRCRGVPARCSQRTFCNSLGCLWELFWIGLVSSFWVALDGVITNWSCLISGLVRTYQTPQLFNVLPYQA